MKRQGFPLNLYFIPDENDKFCISLNGQQIEYENIIEAKKCLNEFCSDLKKEDVNEYNKNVEMENYLENERYKKTIKKENKKISGYIYIIQSGNYYKIGRSRNKKDRIKKYITENPNEINILMCEKVTDYIKTEAHLLNKFKNKKHRGEWFSLNKTDINIIKKIICETKTI
jgi:hypothetical protein